MTAVDVDALDKLREAAALGSLRVGEHYGIHLYAGENPVGTTLRASDATLIAAAVTALPELLAEVRRGRALREAVLSRHERVGGDCVDCGGVKWPCPTVTLVAAVDAS